MNWNSRGGAALTLLSALVAAASGGVLAQAPADYPVKPVRVVVVYGAGGGLDVVTRIVAEPLGRALGRQVVVENRPGAGGNIGTEYVAKQPGDGYTLMVTTNSHEINAFIYKNPGYDPRRDFTPVVQMTGAPSVLIAHPSTPYATLQDLVAAARAQPGKIPFGTAGNGSPTHIAMEIFKSAAGIDLTHVPYKTAAQANGDVLAGQLPLAMAAMPPVMPHIQGGRLRALGVTAEKRFTVLPEVPTVAESGYPGYSHITWIGLFAPAGTPPQIVARLNREVAAILKTPAVRNRLLGLGAEPAGGSTADFGAMVSVEREAMAKLIPRIGLRVD